MLHRRVRRKRVEPLRHLVRVAELRARARLNQQQRAHILQRLAQQLAQIAALFGGGVDGADTLAHRLAHDALRQRERHLVPAKPQ